MKAAQAKAAQEQAASTSEWKASKATNVQTVAGEIVVDDQTLRAKDAIGISDFSNFDIEIKQKAKILIIEIPTK